MDVCCIDIDFIDYFEWYVYLIVVEDVVYLVMLIDIGDERVVGL